MKAVVFNDTSFDHHLGCQLVMRQIYTLSAKNGIEIATVSPVKHKWNKDRTLKKAVQNCDLVIVNGEGTIHSDNRRALRLIKIADFCKELNKPCFLINALYHNNSEEMHSSVRKFTGVYVRDKQSQLELESIGVEARYCPDLTLSVEPHVKHEAGDKLLILDSNEHSVTETLYGKYKAESSANFSTLLAIPKIQKGKDRKVFLFQSYLDRLAYKLTRRKVLTRRLVKAKDIYVAYRERNVNAMLAIVAGASGVVTGRFHGACFALVTETPFLACTTKTYKTQNLLKEVGLDDRLIEIEEVKECAVEAYTDDELLKVRRFLDKARTLSDEMFKEISDRVKV